MVRPHAENFLIEMSKFYEIVIFTAALPDYANFILDKIDLNKVISYKLYREHTMQKGNIHLKVIVLNMTGSIQIGAITLENYNRR